MLTYIINNIHRRLKVDMGWVIREFYEDCCNNITNPLYWFVHFQKVLDTMSRINLWNILKELKVTFKLRVSPIRL